MSLSYVFDKNMFEEIFAEDDRILIILPHLLFFILGKQSFVSVNNTLN